MSLGIRDYKSVVTVGILKTKLYRASTNKNELIEACREACHYLSMCYTDNEEFELILKKSYGQATELSKYLENDNNQLSGVKFRQLIENTLDSYANYLISNGSEVDKVSWIETMIAVFIEEFQDADISNNHDFQFIVNELKDDIINIYSYVFTKEMQKYVSNYSEFLDTLNKLKVSEPQESNIFSRY